MAENKNKPVSKPVAEKEVAEVAPEVVAETVEEQVITAPEPTKDVPTLGFNEDGVMGSTTTKAVKEPKKEPEKSVTLPEGKTALFSTRNLYADGFGKINVGYNIVPNKYVEFWLKQRGVRVATPEEVAEAFA